MLEPLRTALDALRPRHRAELEELVRIPSVSAEGRGIDEAAGVVVRMLEARGLDVRVHKTPGNPVIVATGGRPDGPRMLFYEHYDVQPADPLDEWTVPPFELTERDACLWGRGSADTKAHLVCRLAAIDACREALGDDPAGWTFLIEGEEEIGSPNLEAFIEAHARELRADACLWEFGNVDMDGRPWISLGLKGIATLELTCKGPAIDVHSSLGVVLDNPLYRLSAAIASLRDETGRVLIEGFYDDVDPLPASAHAELTSRPDQGPALRRLYGVPALLVDDGEVARRLECEPCVNINGIHGGYGGPGSKTVLPSVATAKLDIRLVPSQRPDKIVKLLREHLDARGFGDVIINEGNGEAPGRTSLENPFAKLVARTAHDVYGADPVMQISSAGTGPAHPFQETLGVPFALVGCAYPGSRMHAPDEHIRIQDFERAKLHSALICAELPGLNASG